MNLLYKLEGQIAMKTDLFINMLKEYKVMKYCEIEIFTIIIYIWTI